MGEVYEGFEGSVLFKVEVTPGLAVVPDASLGYVQSISPTADSNVAPVYALGSPNVQGFEGGIIEAGASIETLPVDLTVFDMFKRNGSNVLPSYTIHGALGTTGLNLVGAKGNTLRGTIKAGEQKGFSLAAEYMALSAADVSKITPVQPTLGRFTWQEWVLPLIGGTSYEWDEITFSINQNLKRVPAGRGASTTMPVSGVARTGYRIKEGNLAPVEFNLKTFERPTQSVIEDVLTNIASLALVGTDSDGHVLTLTFGNGVPKTRAPQVGLDAVGMWTLALLFRTFVATYS